MAKRGSFGAGMMPGNINQLMKQAQKMQKQMEVLTILYTNLLVHGMQHLQRQH